MIRIGNLKLSLSEREALLENKILKTLGIPKTSLKSYKIVKKSIDARKKDKIVFVYSVEASLSIDERAVCKRVCRGDVSFAEDAVAISAPTPVLPKKRPVVVGAGPAGLFAALTLARHGAKPVLIERGEDVESRAKTVSHFWKTGKLSESSNVQFGEGGAGAFSDGKLNTGTHDKRRSLVLSIFAEHGAPKEILYIQNPHIGSDNLPKTVKSIREEIIALGGSVFFGHTLSDIRETGGRVREVVCTTADGEVSFETDDVILAVGHSARDIFTLLYEKGVSLEAKPFSVGVRIEHLQSEINKSQYGASAGHPALPSASYKLSSKLLNGRTVYTFCMCPGGEVINAASEEGGVVTNGMSLFARNKTNANSALLVNVTPEDFGGDLPISGMFFQQKIERAAFSLAGENFSAPAQTVRGFFENKKTGFGRISPSFMPGVSESVISELFPEYVTSSLKAGIRGFARILPAFSDEEAVLTAPETRSSSPVRIIRDDSLQSSMVGLFPCGEGAGYAGGIMSSAVDGIRVAEAVLKI